MDAVSWFLVAFAIVFALWVTRIIWREERYNKGKLERADDPLPPPPEF